MSDLGTFEDDLVEAAREDLREGRRSVPVIRVFGDDWRCRVCSVCEDGNGQSGTIGGHHWLDQCLDLNNLDEDELEDYAGPIFAGVDVFMSCKHCPAWTPDWEAVHEFDERGV